MVKNPEIYAGDLDRRVTLLSPVYNPHEDEITEWAPVANVWASIGPNYGQEQTKGGRTVATTLVPIVIRYRADVDARWRILYRAKTYEVEALLDKSMRGAQLQLSCKEVQ